MRRGVCGPYSEPPQSRINASPELQIFYNRTVPFHGACERCIGQGKYVQPTCAALHTLHKYRHVVLHLNWPAHALAVKLGGWSECILCTSFPRQVSRGFGCRFLTKGLFQVHLLFRFVGQGSTCGFFFVRPSSCAVFPDKT